MALFKKKASSESAKNQAKDISKLESAVALNDQDKTNTDPELVAVIMAAIMGMLSSGLTSDLKIKSIKRIGRNSPVWNTAGRDEYITSKL